VCVCVCVLRCTQELLQAAFQLGLSEQEIESRLTESSMGRTIAARLGVTAAVAATPPPPAFAAPPQSLPPRPTTPTSLRMRRRQNVPAPFNL
jgi:hypothetical protein